MIAGADADDACAHGIYLEEWSADQNSRIGAGAGTGVPFPGAELTQVGECNFSFMARSA
jgi:hypothetical protein